MKWITVHKMDNWTRNGDLDRKWRIAHQMDNWTLNE